MTEKATKPRRTTVPKTTASGDIVLTAGAGPARFVYTFGVATLRSAQDPKKVSDDVIERSRTAMRQLGQRLLKPGVRLPDRKGVPKFYADEADPKLIVRELDGKRERGTFENGSFKAVA